MDRNAYLACSESGTSTFDDSRIGRDDPVSAGVAFHIDRPILDEVSDGTREITLAVVEAHREVGDSVKPVDGGENVEFDALEHDVHRTNL